VERLKSYKLFTESTTVIGNYIRPDKLSEEGEKLNHYLQNKVKEIKGIYPIKNFRETWSNGVIDKYIFTIHTFDKFKIKDITDKFKYLNIEPEIDQNTYDKYVTYTFNKGELDWIFDANKMGLLENNSENNSENIEDILENWLLSMFPFMDERDVYINELYYGGYSVEIWMAGFDPDEDIKLLEDWFEETLDELEKLKIGDSLRSVIDIEDGQFTINFEFDEDNKDIWNWAVEGDKMNLF